MLRRPPRSTLTDPLVPYTTLFRSDPIVAEVVAEALVGADDSRPVQRRRARARIVVGIEDRLERREEVRRDVADLDRPHAPAAVVEGIKAGRAGIEAVANQGHRPRPASRIEARIIDRLGHPLDPALLHPSPPPEIGRARGGKEWVSTCRSRWSPYH